MSNSRKVAIDQYGRPAWLAEYNNESEAPAPYQVDESDSVTYIRYSADAECAVRRITVSGTVTTIEWAFGAWEERATLQYQQINELMAIDASKVSSLYR